MKDIMLFALLLILAGIQISTAQFPTVCMKQAPLRDRECCPLYDGSKCGSEDGRGRCESITLPEDKSSVRDAWPYYFDRVCICNHNYSGYDCGRCKYGHYGLTCNSSSVEKRRPLSDYNQQEWQQYLTILASTKTYHTEYLVLLEQPQTPFSVLKTSNITLYELFVWQHHYPAKDNGNSNTKLKKDYAHESTGFPTWHRQFLLWFEWEVQYMLKTMGKEKYYTFRIPYWDWRKEKQTDTNSPFKSNRLGETIDNNGLPQVHGEMYSEFLNSWGTICWENPPTFEICDPQNSTGQLQRCPLMDEPCSSQNEYWPSDDHVQRALSLKVYDTYPFNTMATSESFRNRLEGFMPLLGDDPQPCRDNKLCHCDGGHCIQRLLHNSIHIILGISYFESDAYKHPNKRGMMGDVPASANDPIFLNHHAMVDCIFEKWLRNYPNAQYPESNEIPKGHRKDDYIVPFFPLYKHGDMFHTADRFGYECAIESVPVPPVSTEPTEPTEPHALEPLVIAVIVIAVIVIAAILSYYTTPVTYPILFITPVTFILCIKYSVIPYCRRLKNTLHKEPLYEHC